MRFLNFLIHLRFWTSETDLRYHQKYGWDGTLLWNKQDSPVSRDYGQMQEIFHHWIIKTTWISSHFLKKSQKLYLILIGNKYRFFKQSKEKFKISSLNLRFFRFSFLGCVISSSSNVLHVIGIVMIMWRMGCLVSTIYSRSSPFWLWCKGRNGNPKNKKWNNDEVFHVFVYLQ